VGPCNQAALVVHCAGGYQGLIDQAFGEAENVGGDDTATWDLFMPRADLFDIEGAGFNVDFPEASLDVLFGLVPNPRVRPAAGSFFFAVMADPLSVFGEPQKKPVVVGVLIFGV
jgi:hypothetical protein